MTPQRTDSERRLYKRYDIQNGAFALLIWNDNELLGSIKDISVSGLGLSHIDEDEDLDDLNQQILEMATSLAMKESSELHIVHAWKVFGKDLLDLPMAGFIKEEVQEWMMSQRLDIEARFNHVTGLVKKHLKDKK